MAIETILTHPFLRPGLEPPGAPEQRRKRYARFLSWGLVGALHAFLFFAFVLSFRPIADRSRPIIETILMLQNSGNNNGPKARDVSPEILENAPRAIVSAPITLPRPPPIVAPDKSNTTGDILGSVGQSLACSAGSWEHLTQTERNRCARIPWHAMKTPNGSLVMVPASQLPRLKPAPDGEFRVTGSDQNLRDVRTGQTLGQGGCPILQNTPCLHPSEGGAGVNILGSGN